jgi:hypothetical protein
MKRFGSNEYYIVSILLISSGISAFVPVPKTDPRILLGNSRIGGRFCPSSDFKGTKATATSREEAFEVPDPRWNCPTHEDVCSETGVTLSRYMKEMVRANPELEEIESST